MHKILALWQFFGLYYHRTYEYHKTTIVGEVVDKNDSLDMYRKVVWFYSFNSILTLILQF